MKRTKRVRRSGQARAAPDLIHGLLTKYGVTRHVAEHSLRMTWSEIVGDRIARRAWPESVNNGVLLVRVTNSSWMHQLSFMREHIVHEIKTRLAGTDLVVTDVRFELPTRSYDTKVDAEVLRPRIIPPKRPPPPPGPPERMRAIENEAASVEDDELRAIIERTRKRWDL